jgi:PAS domain S-box-containing protein
LMPPHYAREHDSYLHNYQTTGVRKVIGIGREVEGLRRDGTVFPLDLSVSELTLNGRTVYTGIVRDISERRAAENALRASESRYGLVLQGMSVGLWEWDIIGGKISWSQRMMELVGVDEATYDPRYDRYTNRRHPDDNERVDAALQAHLNERLPYDIEYRVRHQAGHYIWIHVTGQADWDENGAPVRMVGSADDITDRKEAESALLAAKDRYDLVIRAMSTGFWELDFQTGTVLWSEKAREIAGFLDGLPLPSFEEFIARRHPDDGPAVQEALKRHLENGAPYDVEYRWFRPDEKMIWLRVTGIATFDADGKPLRMVGSANDVTDRKNAQAEREDLIAALAQSNRELDEFAYVASHDLKAPLRVIDNASTWLQEDLAGKLDEESRENLGLLRGRVARMERLLDDLLEYSRIGRKTTKQFDEIVRGADLKEDLMLLLAQRDGFEVIFDDAFLNVRAGRMPLQQILLNLVNNSIKHHDKETGRIDVKTEDFGDRYRFTVTDDGPGIPEQFHEQVFKMFQTLKPRDRVEGSGIGLAIVRKHIEVLGMTIELQNGRDGGSIFRFTYPKPQVKANGNGKGQ